MGETLTVISTVFWTLHITYTDMATTYVSPDISWCAMMCHDRTGHGMTWHDMAWHDMT